MELSLREEREESQAAIAAAEQRAEIAERARTELGERLTGEREESARRGSELEQARDTLEQRERELRAELERLEEQSSAEMERLEQEVERLALEARAAKDEVRPRSRRLVEEARARQEEAEQRVHEEISARAEVERALAETEGMVEELRTSLVTHQEELEERERELAEADDRATALDRALTDLRESSERERNEDQAAHEAELGELRDEIATERAEIERRLAAAEEQAGTSDRAVAELRATILELEERIRSEADAAATANGKLQQKVRAVQELEAQLAEERAKRAHDIELAARRAAEARRALAVLDPSYAEEQAGEAGGEPVADAEQAPPEAGPDDRDEDRWPAEDHDEHEAPEPAAEELEEPPAAGEEPEDDAFELEPDLPPPRAQRLQEEEPKQRGISGIFGRRRRGGLFRSDDGAQCSVCQRERTFESDDEIAASGWVVGDEAAVCDSCQEDGWQLPEGAAMPFRRSGSRSG
jgi:chromosome segregation ATPase